MKAYQVSNYEGHSEIVFADTPGKAKNGVVHLWDDFIELSAIRRPEFDGYADKGTVPVEVLLAHGWWWECHKCGDRVYEENSQIIDGIVYCDKCEGGDPNASHSN